MKIDVEIASAILQIVLAIVSAVMSVLVIPWLKSTVFPWLKEKRLYSLVTKFVQAAEKLSETGIIDRDEKRNYVIRLLRDKGYLIDNETIALIESAVKELDMIVDSVGDIIIDEFEESDEPVKSDEMIESGDTQTPEETGEARADV